MMYRVDRSLSDYHKGEGIFTDDKAPVELMGMKVIDSLISNEIDYYRDILKKEGIPGLMNN